MRNKREHTLSGCPAFIRPTLQNKRQLSPFAALSTVWDIAYFTGTDNVTLGKTENKVVAAPVHPKVTIDHYS